MKQRNNLLENLVNQPLQMKNKGLFITCEGGEGSGKTTLIHHLEQAFIERGDSVVKTREPGGTKLGDQVRNLLLHSQQPLDSYAELMLFLGARAQHIHEVIKPALLAGKVVLCDRFNDSTVAYQGIARGLGKEMVQDLCTLVCQGTLPDLTFFLDIDPKQGLKRAQARNQQQSSTMDRIEIERLEFHQKVLQGLRAIAQESPERVCILDATQSIESVFSTAWNVIAKRPS